MASLQGPVVCPVVGSKQTGIYSAPVSSPLLKDKVFKGLKGLQSGKTNTGFRQSFRKGISIRCSFSSSSNDNGSMAGNSNENDADYVNSSVIEAGMWSLLSHIIACLDLVDIRKFWFFHLLFYYDLLVFGKKYWSCMKAPRWENCSSGVYLASSCICRWILI